MPRLTQLSSAYKVFANLYFEWDKTEELTVKETVDYVVSLSAMYDIDPEFVTAKTGIPIIGLKQQNTASTSSTSVSAQGGLKKNPNK